MIRMISDLLNLSRIDNQTVQLEVEMTNFTAFMTSILNRFDQIKSQHTVAGKQYEIVRDYPIKSIWVEIDPDKMTQVLDNILNNAIKYSPDGGKITVSMKTTETQLIISISDEGLGIPKKDLPLIFDRFYRVDKARSRAQGGSGLGLAIAKKLSNNIKDLFGLKVPMVRVQHLQLFFRMRRILIFMMNGRITRTRCLRMLLNTVS